MGVASVANSSSPLDVGPSWRELQPRTQWTLLTWFALVGVVACFLTGWLQPDFRISVVGVAMIAIVCVLLRDNGLAALIAIGAGSPALVLLILQVAVEKNIDIGQ